MWTAILIRLSKAHGRIEFEIRYSDGTQTIDKSYSFARINKKGVQAIARDEVARLQDVKDEVIDIVKNQEIDLTPPTPVVKPPPTAAEIAEAAWFKDWHKLQILLRLVAAEIIQPTDSRIDPLKVTLRAGLKNSYLSKI